MTIALCYGSRSQLIAAAGIARVLGQTWEVLGVDAGAAPGRPLRERLRGELRMAPLHAAFEEAPWAGGSDGETAASLAQATELFQRQPPRAVVVIGDTNATLGCALAATQLRIPLVHVEAGLRGRDRTAPAEVARSLVEAMSDVLCAPSRIATSRLRSEGVDGEVVWTGDVAYDVLRVNAMRAEPPAAIDAWPLHAGEPFFLAALRRPELAADPELLRGVLYALSQAPFPVVVSPHPRTRECLTTHKLLHDLGRRVHLLPELGYVETLGAVRAATAVVTDAGSAQRQAYWLGTPCVTLRRETEWTETVTLGANTLVPADEAETRLPGRLMQLAFGPRRTPWLRTAYGDGRAAERVRAAIEACVGAPAAV